MFTKLRVIVALFVFLMFAACSDKSPEPKCLDQKGRDYKVKVSSAMDGKLLKEHTVGINIKLCGQKQQRFTFSNEAVSIAILPEDLRAQKITLRYDIKEELSVMKNGYPKIINTELGGSQFFEPGKKRKIREFEDDGNLIEYFLEINPK